MVSFSLKIYVGHNSGEASAGANKGQKLCAHFCDNWKMMSIDAIANVIACYFCSAKLDNQSRMFGSYFKFCCRFSK